jgi:hypothetical protein
VLRAERPVKPHVRASMARLRLCHFGIFGSQKNLLGVAFLRFCGYDPF